MMALDYSVILNQPDANQQIQQGIGQFLGIREAEAQARMREAAMQQAEQQAQRQAEFQSAFGQAFQSGDRNQIVGLMGQYPDQLKEIQSALGFQDEQKAKTLGTLGIQLGGLAKMNPQAAGQLIVQNAEVLKQAGPGYDPQMLLDSLAKDPNAFADQAEKISLLALGPEKFFDVTGQQAKVAAQLRGQDITMRGQDIQQQEGAANRASAMTLKQLTLKDKALDRQVTMLGRQLENETNDLKRQEIELKLQEKRGQLESARNEKKIAGEGAVATFDRAIETINSIKGSEGFEAAIGVPGVTAYLPGTSAKETQGLIESLKSQAFLAEVEKMKGLGALTESEGRALTAAVGSLNPEMPEAAFKRSLDRIESYFRAGKERAINKYGIQPSTQSQPTTESGGWEIVP